MSSVRTNIRQAVEYHLRNSLTVASGYNYTVGEVRSPYGAEEGLTQYPTIDLYWEREERQNIHLQGNDPLLDLRLVLELVCYLNANREDVPIAQERMLEDLQKFFGINWNIPSQSGEATAFECAYLYSEPWGPLERAPNCGIVVGVEIFYSLKKNDPTVSFHS